MSKRSKRRKPVYGPVKINLMGTAGNLLLLLPKLKIKHQRQLLTLAGNMMMELVVRARAMKGGYTVKVKHVGDKIVMSLFK